MIPKLFQWLLGAGLFIAVWLAFVLEKVDIQLTEIQRTLVLISPLLAVGIFGLVSAVIVLYRVSTFNDCKEAAEEIQQQIKEAKEDLSRKGFKFDDT
ncbi:dolichol-phosphate mannosyltransferase subunit 3 [Magallana gigas]|uniref:dolichol-phosphate mannosyltransferase subunit 3 n=1 Tax=Magallana gigas TaxID=29159 RepID=UPI0005C3A8C6|eukprot:XP_011421164.1 PREDICTED: dolichol-phosphate mannosyltransferase subunit 3-like [Crassostrea gigas]